MIVMIVGVNNGYRFKTICSSIYINQCAEIRHIVEGRVQMSGEGGYLKMDSKKIKDVLRHHSELTQQIHKQVLEIREKLDEVQQQTIEMASYPKIDLSRKVEEEEHIKILQMYILDTKSL